MEIHDEMWEKRNSYIGMAPTFRVVCEECFIKRLMELVDTHPPNEAMEEVNKQYHGGDFDMFLREVHVTKLPGISDRSFANNMHYKCDRCDEVKVFGVAIDGEYYEELMKRRKGKARVVPMELWDDEKKKKILKSLGYL